MTKKGNVKKAKLIVSFRLTAFGQYNLQKKN